MLRAQKSVAVLGSILDVVAPRISGNATSQYMTFVLPRLYDVDLLSRYDIAWVSLSFSACKLPYAIPGLRSSSGGALPPSSGGDLGS